MPRLLLSGGGVSAGQNYNFLPSGARQVRFEMWFGVFYFPPSFRGVWGVLRGGVCYLTNASLHLHSYIPVSFISNLPVSNISMRSLPMCFIFLFWTVCGYSDNAIFHFFNFSLF